MALLKLILILALSCAILNLIPITSLPCKVAEQTREPTWKKIHTWEVEKLENSDDDSNQNCIIIHAHFADWYMFLFSVGGVSSSVSPSVAAARTPHVASSEPSASAPSGPEPAATSRRSVGGCDPRLIGPLRHHLRFNAWGNACQF